MKLDDAINLYFELDVWALNWIKYFGKSTQKLKCCWKFLKELIKS